MPSLGRYDASLQMFVEERRTLSLPHLIFLRYLADAGRLEHAVAGKPAGEVAIFRLMKPEQKSMP